MRIILVYYYIAYHPERFSSFWTLGGELYFAVLQWLGLRASAALGFGALIFSALFFAAYVAALSLERVTALGFLAARTCGKRASPHYNVHMYSG